MRKRIGAVKGRREKLNQFWDEDQEEDNLLKRGKKNSRVRASSDALHEGRKLVERLHGGSGRSVS